MRTILSTEQVTEKESFSYWREKICDVFVQLDASRLSRQTFMGKLENGDLDKIQISVVSADPQHVVRSRSQIAKSSDDFFLLSLQLQGEGYTEQDKREAYLHPGDFVLYDSTRPYVLHFEHPFKQVVFRFPRSLLLSRYKQADQLTSIRVPGIENPVGNMVSTLLRNVAANYPYFDEATGMRIVENSLDLLATALRTVSGYNPHEAASLAYMQRAKARAFISNNLANPNLSPSMVANHLGISIRYLHKLFEQEGLSVASFIRDRRLESCRRDLGDADQSHRTVLDIALNWGFNNAAHFSRIFKNQYEVSPTDYRANRNIDL